MEKRNKEETSVDESYSTGDSRPTTPLRRMIRQVSGAACLALLLVGGAAIATVATAASAQDAAKPATKRNAENAAKETKTAKEQQTAGDTAAQVDLSSLDRIGESCWADLRDKRVYFAHDDLGAEIARGAETILGRKSEIGLKVLSFRHEEREAKGRERRGGGEAGAFDSPGVFHAVIGHNGEPEDKIDAFEEFLLSPEGAKVDVAVLKLSCADIGRSTDVVRVLDRYSQAIDAVHAARPNLRFIHCTAPLREPDHGAKAVIKKMVGAGTDAANATRGRYNDLLRKRFVNSVIFDIARAESRRLDGTEETVVIKNERWPALSAEYGKGAHDLTEAGRVMLGRELLVALSRCCSESEGAKPTVTLEPTGSSSSD